MKPRLSNLSTSIGLLILRLGVGGYMANHGWGKLKIVIDGGFDQFSDPIGLGPGLSLVLATSAEFFCSLLVMAGLATRFAAAPVVLTMAVAAFKIHAGDPWTMQQSGPSKEPALLFLVPFLALILTGPGRFSLDALIRSRRRRGGGPGGVVP